VLRDAVLRDLAVPLDEVALAALAKSAGDLQRQATVQSIPGVTHQGEREQI